MPYKNPADAKKYRDDHRELARVYMAWYRKAHPEKMAQLKRDWADKVGRKNITERRREYHRIRYQSNRSLYNARQREYRRVNSDKVYEKEIKRKFGMTLGDKRDIWIQQGKKCKICCRDIALRSSHIDHIHNSKPAVIRGLLCGSCNRGLGLFGDSAVRLHAAAHYLADINSFPEANGFCPAKTG